MLRAKDVYQRIGDEPSDTPAPEYHAEDAAFLLEDLNARIALEHLLYYALEGGLWETAWFGMLDPTLTLGQFEDAHRQLFDRGLFVERMRDSELGEELFCSVTDRGRAAVERRWAEDEAERQRKRAHGLLTIEDLWAHDVLLEHGPLTREAWRRIAQDPSKGGVTRNFEQSADRVVNRLLVEHREDGTYAALCPQLLEPETRTKAREVHK